MISNYKVQLYDEEEKKEIDYRNLKYGTFMVNSTFWPVPRAFIYAKTSFFCFNETNKFRYACVWLINWPPFDYTLTLCIIINAINIARADYSPRL